jgi:hypothetical protein
MAVSSLATAKSVTTAQLIFGAELCHNHYATVLNVNNYARCDDIDI